MGANGRKRFGDRDALIVNDPKESGVGRFTPSTLDEEEGDYQSSGIITVPIPDSSKEHDPNYDPGCLENTQTFSLRKLWLFTGPEFLMSIA